MLARVQIDHEIDQRALQPRACAGETNESAAAQFRRPLEIEKIQSCAERDVIGRLALIAASRPNCGRPGSRSDLCQPERSHAADLEFRRSKSFCSSSSSRCPLRSDRRSGRRSCRTRCFKLVASLLLRDFLPPISLLNRLRSALQLLQLRLDSCDAPHRPAALRRFSPRRRRRAWPAARGQSPAFRESDECRAWRRLSGEVKNVTNDVQRLKRVTIVCNVVTL